MLIGPNIVFDQRFHFAMAVDISFYHLFPRPHLVERTQHETGEDRQRDVAEMLQRKREYPREARDTEQCAERKNTQDDKIERIDRLHDVKIFPQQDQDEAARYARKNHGTDGNGSAKEDKQQIGRCLGRSRNRDVIGNHYPNSKPQNRLPIPLLHVF